MAAWQFFNKNTSTLPQNLNPIPPHRKPLSGSKTKPHVIFFQFYYVIYDYSWHSSVNQNLLGAIDFQKKTDLILLDTAITVIYEQQFLLAGLLVRHFLWEREASVGMDFQDLLHEQEPVEKQL